MKSSDLKLQMVRIERISGESFIAAAGGKEEVKLRAQFKADILSPAEELCVGEAFDLTLLLDVYLPQETPANFSIEVIGTFTIAEEHAVKELSTRHGVYEAASLLFPYLRQLARPIMEGLSMSDLQFPFYMPKPPPEKKSRPKKASPRQKNA